MTAPKQAVAITQHRQELDFVVEAIAQRAETHDKDLNANEAAELRQKIHRRVQNLLDDWSHIADDIGSLQYQQEVGEAPPLLFDPLDAELKNKPRGYKFKAQRSLRDVEQTVSLWVSTLDGIEVEEEDE